MKIGIIAAMPQELTYLIERLKEAKKHLCLGRVYHTGFIGKHEVVLVESGIGKVMSAVSAALLAHQFKVDAIINTGVAGALAENLTIGDIVVAERLAYYDVDVTAFDYAFGQMAGQPLYFDASLYFIAEMKKQLHTSRTPYQFGLIATGDSFVSEKETKTAITQHFPDVLAVDMEGASIAQVAHSLQLPFLVIRAISDTANQDASVDFNDFVVEASSRSATILISFLEQVV